MAEQQNHAIELFLRDENTTANGRRAVLGAMQLMEGPGGVASAGWSPFYSRQAELFLHILGCSEEGMAFGINQTFAPHIIYALFLFLFFLLFIFYFYFFYFYFYLIEGVACWAW